MPLATGSLSPATDDRDRHPLDGSGHRGRVCQDDVGVQADQLLRERSKAIGVIAGTTNVHPRLRSSVQPKPASACVNAEMRAFVAGSFSSHGMSTPMRRTRVSCCARAASGHAAAPLSPAMNSRRRIEEAICPSRAWSPRDNSTAQACESFTLGMSAPDPARRARARTPGRLTTGSGEKLG